MAAHTTPAVSEMTHSTPVVTPTVSESHQTVWTQEMDNDIKESVQTVTDVDVCLRIYVPRDISECEISQESASKTFVTCVIVQFHKTMDHC